MNKPENILTAGPRDRSSQLDPKKWYSPQIFFPCIFSSKINVNLHFLFKVFSFLSFDYHKLIYKKEYFKSKTHHVHHLRFSTAFGFLRHQCRICEGLQGGRPYWHIWQLHLSKTWSGEWLWEDPTQTAGQWKGESERRERRKVGSWITWRFSLVWKRILKWDTEGYLKPLMSSVSWRYICIYMRCLYVTIKGNKHKTLKQYSKEVLRPISAFLIAVIILYLTLDLVVA